MQLSSSLKLFPNTHDPEQRLKLTCINKINTPNTLIHKEQQYVAVYLDTLTCLFLHTRLLKAHTKLLEAHTRLLETHTRLLEAKINSTILQIKFRSISL